jgi:hypothetical protein
VTLAFSRLSKDPGACWDRVLHIALPTKASVVLAGRDEFRFSRFDLRGKVIASAGVESEILLVGVSWSWSFAVS